MDVGLGVGWRARSWMEGYELDGGLGGYPWASPGILLVRVIDSWILISAWIRARTRASGILGLGL